MPDRVNRYLRSRLTPGSNTFDTLIKITFAASPSGTEPHDAFGAAWDGLPEDQKRAICDAWRELQQSEAQLPSLHHAARRARIN